ncbi:MAG: hypothetical protein E6I87_07665 [Chloroflexi bacterium]|nr:MAG: hypothetical protein E6I87_07665 [Chloroflexota bacterium]
MARAIGVLTRPRLDIRGFVTRNVPLKLAAVAVALLGWYVLSQAQAPEEQTVAFNGGIPVQRQNMPAGYVLRGSLGDVTVNVHGAVGDLKELAVSSFRAEVDLSQYDLTRVGDLQELPVRVSAVPETLKIVEIHPSVVAAKLVPVEAKQMTVQVRYENQPAAGYQAADPTLSPAAVEVRGPSDALREVVSVIVQVRFSDAPNDIHLTPRAVPIDGAGQEVPDIDVQPRNVAVAVAVQQATPTRTVGIIPTIVGQPAAGYWVASATSDPAVVAVRGDPATLDKIDHLVTVAIDVTGMSVDRLVRAPLVLPPGTSLAQEGGTVQVAIAVRAVTATRLFSVAVQPSGLRSDLVADFDPKSLDVVVSGPLSTLQGLRVDQIAVVVDLAGKAAGTYQIDAAIRTPAGVSGSATGPARITVVVRSRS